MVALCLRRTGSCGAFLAVRKTRLRFKAEIARLNSETERLKVRPYDEAHRRLAQEKITVLGPNEKDLLRYLLNFGCVEQGRLFLVSGMTDVNFAQTLDRVARTRLVDRSERQRLQ